VNDRLSEDLVLRAALFHPILTYADAVDSKRFDLFRDVFHSDASLGFGAGEPMKSLSVIIEAMEEVHRHLIGSQHRMTNFFVDEVDSDTAVTRTYGDALLIGGPAAGTLTYRDVGTYHDTLVRSDAGWLITSRDYKSLWSEGDSAAVLAPPSGR
jgi:hypothetical protein